MVDWIDIDKNGGGSGETIVTITASSYSELVERTTSLTVRTRNTNLSKTVSITQMPREAITITVSPSSFHISRNGGRYYFNIVSNGYWEVVGYPSWVTLSQTSGTGNATVYFTASTTDSITERTGYITLRTLYGDIEDNRVRVTLTQERAYQYIYVSPSELVFIYTGGSKTINVTTNGFWTASTESEWVTLSQTEGTGNTVVTVTVDDYLGEPKSAQIRFATIDDEVYVDLTQYGVVPYLTFNDDTLIFPQVGGSETLRVNSNIRWEIETLDDLDLPISVSTQTLVLPSTGGSNTLSVTTDYGWTATTDSEWFTLSDTSGKGNGVITVTASGGNLTDEAKTGLIKVSNITTDIYIEVKQLPDYSQLPFTILMLTQSGYVGYEIQDTAPLEYQLNDGEWTSVSSGWTYYTQGSFNHYRILLEEGDKLRLRGDNTSLTNNNNSVFYMGTNRYPEQSRFRIYGNIMSLIDKDEFTTLTTLPSEETFSCLFQGCAIKDASGLVLPADTLTRKCYNRMFRDCSLLTTAPELPATTLAVACYVDMFSGCTSLTQAPSVLPATTLTNSCYETMFYNCRNLTTAPDLPATTLAPFCYAQMFYNCWSLNYVKCLATNTDLSATQNWLYGVQSEGTFVKAASMNDWPEGVNGIPNNWIIQNDS